MARHRRKRGRRRGGAGRGGCQGGGGCQEQSRAEQDSGGETALRLWKYYSRLATQDVISPHGGWPAGWRMRGRRALVMAVTQCVVLLLPIAIEPSRAGPGQERTGPAVFLSEFFFLTTWPGRAWPWPLAASLSCGPLLCVSACDLRIRLAGPGVMGFEAWCLLRVLLTVLAAEMVTHQAERSPLPQAGGLLSVISRARASSASSSAAAEVVRPFQP